MPDDEAESAVSAWANSLDTQREIRIARVWLGKNGGSPADAWMLALGVEILAALNMYGDTTEPEEETPPEMETEPNDDDEPWKAR